MRCCKEALPRETPQFHSSNNIARLLNSRDSRIATLIPSAAQHLYRLAESALPRLSGVPPEMLVIGRALLSRRACPPFR